MARLKITKPKEKKRVKKRNRKTLIGISIFLIPILIFSAYMWYSISAIGSPGKKMTLNITSGSSTARIGDVLEKNDIINSGTAFTFTQNLQDVVLTRQVNMSFVKILVQVLLQIY
ncbi:MAG: hypothetical protein V9G25_06815 [Acidimicrobiia bacterium]